MSGMRRLADIGVVAANAPLQVFGNSWFLVPPKNPHGPPDTPSLIKQIKLSHEDAETTMMETCQNLRISKSSYYNALKTPVVN